MGNTGSDPCGRGPCSKRPFSHLSRHSDAVVKLNINFIRSNNVLNLPGLFFQPVFISTASLKVSVVCCKEKSYA